jgi:MoxR-like ATPase
MTDQPQIRVDPDESDEQIVAKVGDAHGRVLKQIRRTIVGMDSVIDEMMIAILSRGHCLLVGVPGLAKTLLISSLGKALSLSFKRIQFTPDLMPSDITGTELLQEDQATHERRFRFSRGPIFANLVLADEINRTPPKTQAALLEAMQEKKISAGGDDYPLDLPFFVLATQNPIEQEGTYPLPEAQLDRFLFNIVVSYPDYDDEIEVMKRVTGGALEEPDPVLDAAEIVQLQDLVQRVPAADHVFHYAARLVRSTRPETSEALDFVKEWLSWGAGPRASLNLVLAGKARAVLNGRRHVSIDDIRAVAHPILRHRIIPNFSAQSAGVNSDEIVDKLLEAVPSDETLYDGKTSPV